MNLEVKRAAVGASLQGAIEDLATPMLEDGRNPHSYGPCMGRASLMHSYFRELQRCDLWPLSEVFRIWSLATISQRILSFQESNSTLENPRPTEIPCRCSVCQTRFKPLVESARTTLLSSITGLCLDCIKAGGPRTKEERGNCRISHSEAL